MPASNRIKFFDVSKSLFEDGATASASSGNSVANRALDKNAVTKWRTVGSSDAVTETFTITLSETSTIDRIIVTDHNWKSYTIKYDVGGLPTDFTSVFDLEGSVVGGISESSYALDTSYYEFASVSTDTIYIEVTTTQVADAEKFASQIIVTSELGTLNGYPITKSIRNSRNQRVKETLSGKSLITKTEESISFDIDFRTHPTSKSTFRADLDLMMTLFDREENFLVWLCGGGQEGSEFRYALRGFRLKDIYEMQIDSDIRTSYKDNNYNQPVNMRISLTEAI